ncbi:MAG: addiction module protein [Pseudomonadales bacterium]
MSVEQKLSLIEAIHDSLGADPDSLPHEYRNMDVEQRLDLCGRIQDSIAPEDYPLPEWQVRIVQAELEAFRRNGDPGLPADEVLRELRALR